MASYTKTLHAIRSFNFSSLIQYGNKVGGFTPPHLSDTLYVATHARNSGNFYPYDETTCDIWFPVGEIPKGKNITSCEIHIYVRHTFDEELTANRATFKARPGWNIIPLTKFNGSFFESMNNVVIGQPKIVKPRGDYSNDYSDKWTEIDSHTGTNKPYLVVTYEDVAPDKPIQLFPSNANIDSRTPIKFSWEYSSKDNQLQSGYEIQYSINNQVSWTTVTGNSSNWYHNFETGTFPFVGAVQWKVRVKDGGGIWSSWSNVYKFTTSTEPQRAPVILSPYEEYLDVSDTIYLEWTPMSNGGEYQTKYEINWSKNSGLTWFEITNESGNHYHIVPGNSFTTGTITWRVRTYNNYDEASPWSELKSFHLIGRPATPDITDISNYSKPTIKWISDSQQIYELEVWQDATLIYSSGRIASILIFQHHVDKHLSNGRYRVRLRVKNVYDLWSDYREKSFTISRDNPPIPDIIVISGEYKTTIETRGLSNKTYAYREGLLLGEMINGVYEDYTGVNNKEYNYFVRTINIEENFSDSESMSGKCSFKGNTIALESNPGDFLSLKYNLGSKPNKSIKFGNTGESMQFDGRDYPSYEFSDMKTLDKDLTFSVSGKELEKMKELVSGNSTIIYRDFFEENIYGIVTNAKAAKTRIRYTLEFTINKIKEV